MEKNVKKYMIDTEENEVFLQEIRENLLAFGHRFPSPQGSSYYLGDDGTPWKERSRETWITCRMAHVYSIGTLLGHAGSGELVDAALAEAINTSAVLYHVTKKERYAQFMKYLDEQVLDHVNGSWFHQMNEKGEVTGSVWPGKSDLYHAFQATLIPYCDPAVSVALAAMEL